PLHQLPAEVWDDVLNTNLRGVFYSIRCFAPMMIRARSGHIINISSLAGKNALPNGAAYAASKWGLNGLSYSVAEELRSYHVRVSVLCPGSVDTELSPHAGKDPGKMLQASDVAHAVAMLATPAPPSFVSEILLRRTLKPGVARVLPVGSLLKQILKGLPGILRPRRCRSRGFLLHHDPHGVERALVRRVLACNALGDRLHAFEPAGGVEVGTLLAG